MPSEHPGDFNQALTNDDCICAIENFGMKLVELVELAPAKHIFTHLEWHMKGYSVRISDISENKVFTWVTIEEIVEQCAIPSVFKSFIPFVCN